MSNRKKVNKRKLTLKLILIPLVAIILFIYIYPLYFLGNTSVKSEKEFIRSPIGIVKDFTLENFAIAWDKLHMASNIKNSLLYVGVSTPLCVAMAFFLAYPLARHTFKWSPYIYTAFMIGMFLPDGSIPKWRMFFHLGLYNTRIGYILAIIGGGGVMLMMFVAYIKSIPKDLDDAAMIDGSGYVQFMIRILAPLMMPVFSSMGVLCAIGLWNETQTALIYLTNDEYFSINAGLYVFKNTYSTAWSQLTAALVMVALPMIILYILLQKYIVNGIIAGSIKA